MTKTCVTPKEFWSVLWSRSAGLLAVVMSLVGVVQADEQKWVSLVPHVDTSELALAGEWTKNGESISVSAANGARMLLPAVSTIEYDLKVSFTRKTGQHSVGMIVVHGGKQVAFEVDAWGMNLAGFQNLARKSIRDNATRRTEVRLENGRQYVMTVEVRKNSLRGLLDDKEIAIYQTDGSDLSLSDLWAVPDSKRLGLLAWDSATDFHTVEIRSVNGEAISIARGKTSVAAVKGLPVGTKPTAKAQSSAMSPRSNNQKAGRQHVLIVIANGDFFYSEYADPRAELERAGIRVTVAAGRKAASRPHSGSGEGGDGGVVMPDLALRDVKVSDYDAILFSGGWGSSMYQFAFTGRYNNASYNGDRETKERVNRIINEFIEQDKYVCALCNAVSVLAWARVKGQSPLAGKHVCAPVRQAAAGIYNGRPDQPSCRWHPEQNGAILSPPGAIGRPDTVQDDVLVDGKIITGEDDGSAREMGRRIAEILLKQA